MTTKTDVRVTLANGVSWVTTINTDDSGAVDYYFEAGEFEQPDGTVSPVVSVETNNRIVTLSDWKVGQAIDCAARAAYHGSDD